MAKKDMTAQPSKAVSKMRTEEEIRGAVSLLVATQERIEEMHGEGKLDEETAEAYRETVQTSIDLLEWVMGSDVQADTSNAAAIGVTEIAHDIAMLFPLEG